ncbi:T9SS-dependent choice-of-anchor J family protein [Algoriphagus vanfongensis]|uniref:T9SS-dependent choice-of-anchor J family protein n=1 Tax=Algoriphagus vanfongensis TaxID=426371 RepID=UPI000429CC55|nr:choice-of-anchor J domain-containing protein [Algoriphagus vanfongensis]
MKINSGFLYKVSMLLYGAIFTSSLAFSQEFTLQPLHKSYDSGSKDSHTHNEKCAHGHLQELMEKEMGYFGTKDFFENWIDTKLEQRRNQPQILSRAQEEVRKIPVVFHIVHNGEAVGTGSNIPVSQIESQLRILNEDFRRLNADASQTPAEFLPVAADAMIEFVIAKQDPDGLPTDGIVRIQGPQTSYVDTDATMIGQLTQWNPEEYLNIWVVPLTSPYIGYASFPISDLPGLNFSPTPAIIDGVTIDYRYFGTGGSATGASLGRTATHEVGHYFGLRHIWGDGGCGVDDYVADTPEQDNSNNSCSANASRFSCDSNDMIQNFMDYTPDACMNLFTAGQVERFNVVLANSPRRTTLINNRATQDPVLADRDLAISRVIAPGDFTCSPLVSPQIEVINAGENTITSARLELRRNGTLIENRRFSLILQTGQNQTLTFQNFSLQGGENEIEFLVTQVNDAADENAANNRAISNPVLQTTVSLPIQLDLGNIPSSWSISNPDESMTWEKTSLTISGAQEDLIYLRNYEYEAPGTLDYFISPVIDLHQYPNAQVVFEMAHAPYNQDGFQDNLIVAVSTDCGNTFEIANATYNKSGTSLETSSATLDEFIPTTSSQFRTELVNLAPFAELGSVRVAFINLNAYGNNIYLKNIRILESEEYRYEVQLEELLSPFPISDGRFESEILTVRNTGNLPVSKFVFTKSTNSGTPIEYLASGNAIAPGQAINMTGSNTTVDGLNRLDFEVSMPNFDQNGGTVSTLTRYVVVDGETTLVPWRQNFDNSSSISPWTAVNPRENRPAWEVLALGSESNNVSAVLEPESGFTYWLGSPIFDLSDRTQASVFFDVAAGQVGANTSLKVLISGDAGENYYIIWEGTGASLSTVSTGSASPNSTSDFVRNYIDISDYTGTGSESVRLAFVLEVADGQNSPVYLDNIELFLTANPNPVIPGEGKALLFPNPATAFFNIAFNLPQYEDVTIQIVSASGSLLHEVVYPETLNQTYSFSRELFPAGLYIVKITSNSISETKKLIIN